MRCSDAGRGFIKAFEALRLTPYRDDAGNWTVGYGHLIGSDEPIVTWTHDHADAVVAATPSAEHCWCAGNHDMRFAALLTQLVPQYEGVPGLELKDHFPQWRSCWRVDINGSVIVRHRELGGEHADYRNTQTQGVTLVTGHDHRIGVTPYRGYRGVTYGVRCGFMCDAADDPQFVEYLESKSPNWHAGFVVLTFRDGRLLYPELVTKHADGVVCWRGELIEVSP